MLQTYEEASLCPLIWKKKEKLVEGLPESNEETENKLAAEWNW